MCLQLVPVAGHRSLVPCNALQDFTILVLLGAGCLPPFQKFDKLTDACQVNHLTSLQDVTILVLLGAGCLSLCATN